MRVPHCPECGSPMRLEVWRSGPAWRCDSAPRCGATRQFEGDRPTPDLLSLLVVAQDSFNRLWLEADRMYATIGKIDRVVARVKEKARERAYAWLAQHLGVDAAELHIGMLSPEDCRRVITACRSTSDKAIRDWAKAEVSQ